MATKFTLCPGGLLTGTNYTPSVSNNAPFITYNGFSYDSLEDFDANNMPRHIFMDKPNVVMAYAGTKKVSGVDTGMPCVVVCVSSKDPSISTVDMIPSVLPDGVITDVIESPQIDAFGTCTSGVTTFPCEPHGDTYRPLVGGISAMESTGTACTLGIVVMDNTDGSLVALTNNHCTGLLYDPLFDIPAEGNAVTAGLSMLQPSPADGGVSPADEYGLVKRAKPMQFGLGGNNSVDGAISSIGLNDASSGILEVSNGPFPFASQLEYGIGTDIIKSGRTTGIIEPPLASITSMSAAVNVNYGADSATFTNQIIYESPTLSSTGGDSGAVILASVLGEIKVIGLNFAGNGPGTLGVANHINVVASQLNISSWDGDVIVTDTAFDSIKVNGLCYSKVGASVDPISHIVESFYDDCDDCLGVDNNSSSSFSSISSSSSSSNSTEQMSTSSESSSSTEQMSTSSESSSSTEQMSTSSESSSSTQNRSSSSSSLSSDFDIISNIDKTIITHFNITVNSLNQIELSWRGVKGSTGYSLERKNGFSSYEEVYDGNGLKYLDTNVEAGLFYSYRIRAFSDDVEEYRYYGRYSYSNATIFAPLEPSDIKVVKSGEGLWISWIDGSSYEDGFVIQRISPDETVWSTRYYSRKNKNHFLDTDIGVEGTYKYRVASYSTMIDQTLLYSDYSNELEYDVSITDISNFTDRDTAFVEFGQTTDIEVDYGSSVEVSVLGIGDGDIFWFMDNGNNSLSGFGSIADLFIYSFGDFSVRVEKEGSDQITNINVKVKYVDFRRNPKKPVNIKSRLSLGLLGLLSWNSDDESVSYFNVYRGFKGDIDLVSKSNIIGTVSAGASPLFSFLDLGLAIGQNYEYTVVAISDYGKTSLYNGSIYVGFDKSNLSTDSVGLAISPPSAFVKPNSSVGLISNKVGDWGLQESVSGSILKVDSSGQSVTYLASDKWGVSDVIKIESDGDTSYSNVTITEII